jgi:hypothetical protein
MPATLRTGVWLLNSIAFDPTTKKLLQQIQKSISSSKTLQPLSMIVAYVNNRLKHRGVLKVLLTLKGWVPSPPMLSGPLVSWTMKKMTTNIIPHSELNEDINSGERVMKWP